MSHEEFIAAVRAIAGNLCLDADRAARTRKRNPDMPDLPDHYALQAIIDLEEAVEAYHGWLGATEKDAPKEP